MRGAGRFEDILYKQRASRGVSRTVAIRPVLREARASRVAK